MMRCLDGEFNSVLVAGGEGGLVIKYTHLDHFLPE